MGVYIKGFDVPKDCAECDDDGLRGLVGCQFFSFGVGRPPFCPLTEVKKPHGRLIDAEKAIEEMDDVKRNNILVESPLDIERCKCVCRHTLTIIEAEGE